MKTFTTTANYQIFEEPNGTLALICKRCLLTIAMGTDRDDLQAFATKHVCEQAEPLTTNTERTVTL